MIRRALGMIPASAMVPVLGPPAIRGMRWRAGLDRCWPGTFEIGKRRTLLRAVRTGAVVFDVGAHAGYYTMLFSARAGVSGRVLAEGRPTVFLATHGATAHRESCAVLSAAGYDLRPLDGQDIRTTRELAAYPQVGPRVDA